MKISNVLRKLIKALIGISLVYIAIGVIIEITEADIFFFRNSIYIGMLLFIIGLALHLVMCIYLNYKINKSTILPIILLVILISFSISMYIILNRMFTASLV